MLEPLIFNLQSGLHHRALPLSWDTPLQAGDSLELTWVEAIANLCRYQQALQRPMSGEAQTNLSSWNPARVETPATGCLSDRRR